MTLPCTVVFSLLTLRLRSGLLDVCSKSTYEYIRCKFFKYINRERMKLKDKKYFYFIINVMVKTE